MKLPPAHFVNGNRLEPPFPLHSDVGTQYRSGIYWYDAPLASRDAYQRVLSRGGFGMITTEILAASEFYYAEEYHRQYLAKNPGGYCRLGGIGLLCPACQAAAVNA
jgi:peptide-methionine (S)-S-oxide reductase